MLDQKVVNWNTDYGKIESHLKKCLEEKHMSKYKLCRLTGIKTEIINKYYYNRITRFDREILAKICYVLDCDIFDIITYIPKDN